MNVNIRFTRFTMLTDSFVLKEKKIELNLTKPVIIAHTVKKKDDHYVQVSYSLQDINTTYITFNSISQLHTQIYKKFIFMRQCSNEIWVHFPFFCMNYSFGRQIRCTLKKIQHIFFFM